MEQREIKPYRREVMEFIDTSYMNNIDWIRTLEERYDLGTIVRKLPIASDGSIDEKETNVPLHIRYWRGENENIIRELVGLTTPKGLGRDVKLFIACFGYIYYSSSSGYTSPGYISPYIQKSTFKKTGKIDRSRRPHSVVPELDEDIYSVHPVFVESRVDDEFLGKDLTQEHVAQIDNDVLDKLKRLPNYVRNVLLLD